VWVFGGWVFLGGCTQKTTGFWGVRTRVSEPWFLRLRWWRGGSSVDGLLNTVQK